MINPKNLKKSILDYAIRGELSAKFRRDLAISHGLDKAYAKSSIMSHGLDFANAKSLKSNETETALAVSNPCDNSKNEENLCDVSYTTAFDEIAAYNAKITQMKGQRETLLLQIEKQHKSEKNAHRKARLKTLSGSLKAKIKSYRTITPLNQNAEFTPPFDIPKEWAWVKLGDLGEFKKGPFGSALTKSMFVPKSANSVKVYEQKNAIQKNEKLGDYFITKEYFESSMQGFIVKGGDIIVSCAGTIGEIYKLPSNSETGIINQALMRIRLNRLSIYDYFKVIFDFAINENSDASKGTAIKNIPPFEILKNLPIPLPPLAEQQFIAVQLEQALTACEQYESTVNALLNLEDGLFNKISKSVLDYAIHGELSAKFRRDLGISHGLAKSLIMSHGLDFAHAKSFKNNEIKSKETEMPLGISNPCDTLQNKENPCDIAPPTAFDEIAAYNAKITQMKGQRETLLLQIEKQLKSEKNAHRKARLKTLSGSLKNKIKTYRTIIPLNQNAEFTPPFEIPNSWAWVKLGEIGIWKSGSTPSREKSEFYINGTINWLKTGDLNDGFIYQTEEKVTEQAVKKTNLNLNKIGSVLIAMYGATIGRIGITQIPLTTNQACCACDCNALIFNKYLFYFLLQAREYFLSIAFGSGQPNISKEKITETPIPLPPLAEQRFIAEKLEKLLDLCKKLKTKP